MTQSTKRALYESAAIADLKAAAALVTRPRPVPLPDDLKRRNARLLALLAAERRRSRMLVDGLR